MAAQLILMNGLSRRRAALVQRGGDQLLAGAALAGDEHRGGRVRDLVDDLGDLLHLRATRRPATAGRARPRALRRADSWVRIALAMTLESSR